MEKNFIFKTPKFKKEKKIKLFSKYDIATKPRNIFDLIKFFVYFTFFYFIFNFIFVHLSLYLKIKLILIYQTKYEQEMNESLLI